MRVLDQDVESPQLALGSQRLVINWPNAPRVLEAHSHADQAVARELYGAPIDADDYGPSE